MTGTTRNHSTSYAPPAWVEEYLDDVATLAVGGDEDAPSAEVVAARLRLDALSVPERELVVAAAMGITAAQIRNAYGKPRRARDNGPTVLYRHFAADDTLLYVGIATDEQARWRKHRQESPWVPFVSRSEREVLPTRDEAEAAERDAIRSEHPTYNMHLSRDTGRRDQRIAEFESRIMDWPTALM